MLPTNLKAGGEGVTRLEAKAEVGQDEVLKEGRHSTDWLVYHSLISQAETTTDVLEHTAKT